MGKANRRKRKQKARAAKQFAASKSIIGDAFECLPAELPKGVTVKLQKRDPKKPPRAVRFP